MPMGFLKRFFRNVFREGSTPVGTSSFEQLSEEELEAHLGVSRYGDFALSDPGTLIGLPSNTFYKYTQTMRAKPEEERDD